MNLLPPLTIRNLTTTPVQLRYVERNCTQNATSFTKFYNLMGSKRSKSSHHSHLDCLKSNYLLRTKEEQISITIEPFQSSITKICRSTHETIRLTFIADGQQYQVNNAPSQSPYSTTLTCLSRYPRLRFTAVYHPSSSHLALFSTTELDRWMSKLEDDIPLSALSIPGTHNSPTCYKAFPSVRCQAVSIKEQLENGIRFLDIRVQPEKPKDPSKDYLILVHSAFPVSLTGNKYFRDVINTIEEFLDAHPTETVILSLKREGVGRSTDQQLCRILYDHYTLDQNRWFTDNRIPTLGEVRKKIVLIRRFCLDESVMGENRSDGWAIDAECWPDNCADGSCAGGNIRIQDFYELSAPASIEKKIAYSIEQLVRSAQSMFDLNSVVTEIPKQPFFVNFLSASSFWSVSCWPEKVAAKVNPHVVEHLCRNHYNNEQSIESIQDSRRDYMGYGSTGIVVCDWVGKNNNWDIVYCIVGMNSRLQML